MDLPLEQYSPATLVAIIEGYRSGDTQTPPEYGSHPCTRQAYDSACAQIHRRHSAILNYFLNRHGLTSHDREEISNIVFWVFFQNCKLSGNAYSENSINRFLRKTARNAVIDLFRKSSSKKRNTPKTPITVITPGTRVYGTVQSLDALAELVDQTSASGLKGRLIAPIQLIPNQPMPRKNDTDERCRLAMKYFEELPQLCCDAIEMLYWRDMTDNQSAIVIGVPPSTIKAARHRGLSKLREEFYDAGYAVPLSPEQLNTLSRIKNRRMHVGR